MANLSNFNLNKIKDLLDLKTIQYNTPDFIEDDPISLPHRFTEKKDMEIIGFIVALISWGKRNTIIKNGEKLIQIMGESPYEFVMNYDSKMLDKINFVHRTFNKYDLDFILRGLQRCYTENNSLEAWFALEQEQEGMKSRIINLRNHFLEVSHQKRSEKHLANPGNGSAAKRINMFLRWMVRKDTSGVDFGLWNAINRAELMVPLDVHTGNIARLLGLLQRKQNDWKALEELMSVLRSFDSTDPSKYDFALFGLGVSGEFNLL